MNVMNGEVSGILRGSMPFLIEVKADGADMDLLKEILVNVYELKPKKILKKSDKIDVR